MGVGDRRVAEAEPPAAELRYRALFDGVPLAMWVYDLETLRVLEVNEEAARRHGLPRDALLQRTVTDLHTDGDTITRDLMFDGVRARLVVVHDGLARPAVSGADAISAIAHEFNNILCVILSYSDTLLALLEPSELRDDIAQIHRAGTRGAALVRQLFTPDGDGDAGSPRR